ncbi:2-phytyl-1,4-beta-naphthoquinone methyltransferase, chloroplastic-like isoform X3 [Amborella trichopoda]|uniref:2-phytyl-1,4-beta-naphthoquinone methyltransferase, chloroplastic-like isoform X3 n=1 Tax=Amborella trichopoda TaxID=13333 RepID=UPI0009C0D5D6|nr:2-phytyl-1,4-beta-naphthoquinone methyltransferase, chloroplastic-like isoform X3 [Amborella trichopoda]|eukprot:XP_020520856.1 2-phytyl-1,4-beta-naphthoquinone methyltransferase, chloroplastic-like isoform X3 [Amborella trichopoda]
MALLHLAPPFPGRLPPLSCKFRPISGEYWASQPSQRKELFNRIAPSYDNLNDLFSLGQHRVWKRMAVSWSGATLGLVFFRLSDGYRAKDGDYVLDLCCGSGDLTFLLSEKVGVSGKVTGLDFSREQLSIAFARQQQSLKACYNNIVWFEGDALDLPFEDRSFDAVTVGFGLRNLVDRRKALMDIHRVLKKDSRVSILDFNKSEQPFITLFQVITFFGRSTWFNC